MHFKIGIFNRNHLVFFVVIFFMQLYLSACKKIPQKNKDRINILFLMSDQHRGDFLGAAGAGWIKTPNLDQLAHEGILFTKAYSSVPSCTPARTAIFTGLSPWNHGMLGYMNEASQTYECEMPALFTQNGYITQAVGKNHFGPPSNTHGYQNVKLEEGWHSGRKGDFKCDYQKWFETVAPNYNLNATGLGYTDHRGGISFQFADSLHATHWTAERAIDFLKSRQKDDSPWFLKVSFQRPHPPFDPPKSWLEYYENVEIPMPKVGDWAKDKYINKTGSIYDTPNASSGIYPDNEIMESRRTYAAGLSFVDEQIGRIIKELKEIGQYENTLILYTSDHGDMMGDQNMWRKCRPYDPSARIPFIIRWPESLGLKAKREQKRTELIELRDIFPSFADAANIKIPVHIDGESVLRLIRGENHWREMIGLEHSVIYEKDNAWVALTDGRYKYIYFTLTGEEQLFDLEKDPFEMKNLIHSPEYLQTGNNWYNKMVEYLRIRGPEWVQENKLQIQKKSILKGENFPNKKQ
jgi:arylsulfatase